MPICVPTLGLEAGSRGASLEDLRKLFGSSLRRCRTARGLTQAGLAEATGLSLEMIGRLERGQTTPSFETLSTITSVLRLPIGALFGAEPTRDDSERGRLLGRIDRLLAETPDKELLRVEKVLAALLSD